MNHYNPFDQMQEPPAMNDLTPEEQQEQIAILTALYGCCSYIVAIVVGILLCVLIGSCATPKAVERTEHHSAEADTMAIQSAVDVRMSSWYERMDSLFSQRIRQYTEQQSSQSQERELISETITTTTDSLGRAVRQEQRTISRDIQREQQLAVRRLEQEMDISLQKALDRQDSIWQQRLEAVTAHWDQSDSTHQSATPVPQDSRPWYRRWADNMQWLAIGIILAGVAWITRRWWMKFRPRTKTANLSHTFNDD